MVSFYGAGLKTQILNVEGKLSKPLSSVNGTLVVKASDRDTVLNEISARMARFRHSDPNMYEELEDLRQAVRQAFNNGVPVGDEYMDMLYFLDPKTRDLVDKMSSAYDRVITPKDFEIIGKLMNEKLSDMVPILNDFTSFFGRLAESFLETSKPSTADFDWKQIALWQIRGSAKRGWVLPDIVNKALDIKPGTPVKKEVLQRLGLWTPGTTLHQIINGVDPSDYRRTGAKYTKFDVLELKDLIEIKLFNANKLPKSWTTVPSVNFDKKVLEQGFSANYEQRLSYRDAEGRRVDSIIQVPVVSEATWWQQVINKKGKINDIADVQKARTAFGVNMNHSNDAVIVRRFHEWGMKNGVPTSTIHDAFFANAADMLKARKALREIYADMLDVNIIELLLAEMRARGLPEEVYQMYLKEAKEKGLIGGSLTRDMILEEVPDDFSSNRGWYGVG